MRESLSLPCCRQLTGYRQGVTVPLAYSRFADDEIVIDDNCTAAGVPDGSCVGFRQKQQRSGNVARCTDNNQTVRMRCWGLSFDRPCLHLWRHLSLL